MAYNSSRNFNMPWKVQLIGDSSDLQHLADSFVDDELRIVRHDDDFVLMSSAFGDDMDAISVRTLANDLVALIDGAARILLRAHTAIRTGWALRHHDDGEREHHIFVEPARITIRGGLVSIRLTRADGSVEERVPGYPIRQYLKLASADSSVRLVLQAIAAGPLDWINMYRIFEIIRSDMGGIDKFAGRSDWPSLSELRLFAHTANSPEAVGLAARHGVQTNQPPREPMKESQAKDLVRKLIELWVGTKVRVCNLADR